MAMRVDWVRYGRPAAIALRAAVAAAKGDEPLAPVTVVVPTNHVGVASRRLIGTGSLGPACGRGVGVTAVDFLTVARLAELLGAPALAAAGRRPVSTPVLAAAVRAELGSDPGVFGPVAGHTATEAALVGAYRELRDVSPGAAAAVAAQGARAADVIRVCQATARRLAAGWYDEVDLADAARLALPGARGRLGPLLVYLPQRLSRWGARLLIAASDVTDVHVLAGTTGVPKADAEVQESVRRLAAGAGGPPRADEGGFATAGGTSAGPDAVGAPFLPDPAAGGAAAAGRTRIVTTSDPDDEVRHAVRAVVDAVRAGTPLDRIAILHAGRQPYARLVHEHLGAAGIAVNGAAVIPVAGRVAGRSLLELLAMTGTGVHRKDLFAWLAATPTRHDGRPTPVAAWERLSRRAGVVAGRDQWDQRLVRLGDELEAQAVAAEAEPEAPAWLADRRREDAARARSLRGFVLRLLDEIDAAAAHVRSWAVHAAWAATLLDDVVGGASERRSWPADERAAAERVDRALDRLAALDAVEGEVGLDVFARTLELELESDLGRVGRFGRGVLVGDVSMGLGLALDLVVVLGLVEGAFPAPVRDDSLLADVEREAAGGELPLRRQRVGRQHRQLLAALAAGRRHLLCIPRGDLRRTSERVPSRWALDTASQLAGRRLWSPDLHAAVEPWLTHVPSFGAGLRVMTSPATDQEHRLRSLLGGIDVDDAALRAGRAVVAGRRSDCFTRFDGHLAGLAIPSPADRVTSPTRLERWAACPFGYLLEHVLGARPVENPEEQLTISPLDRGNLVHEVLEAFLELVLRRPPQDRPEPSEPWSEADRKTVAWLGRKRCDEYEARGLTGKPIFWRRDRDAILADLQRFVDKDDEHRRTHGTRPLAAELAFGMPDAGLDAVAIPLPDGRSVRFRGRADRVDLADDATVHIVDYKSGSAKSYSGLCAADPDLRATRLQLAVYGAAGFRLLADLPDGVDACGVSAEYWFISAKGRFERIGYVVTSEVLDRVGRNLAVVVAGIEAGVFPPRPVATSTALWVDCHPCDPDALGTTELRRAWERKRAQPALAPYARLAEPLADPADELTIEEDAAGGS